MSRPLPRDLESDRMSEEDCKESLRTSPRPKAAKAKTAFHVPPKAAGAVVAVTQQSTQALGQALAVCECTSDGMFCGGMASLGMFVCAVALLVALGFPVWKKYFRASPPEWAACSTALLGPDVSSGRVTTSETEVSDVSAPTASPSERAAQSVPAPKGRRIFDGVAEHSGVVYVIDGQGGSNPRKAHYSRTCQHLQGAKFPIVKHAICSTCKAQGSQSNKMLSYEAAKAEWDKLQDAGVFGSEHAHSDPKRVLSKCDFCKEDPPDHVGNQCPRKHGNRFHERAPLYRSTTGLKCVKCRNLASWCVCY